MEIKDQFKVGGQRFKCVGANEYEIHRWVTLYDLESRCVDCGRPFRTSATKTAVRLQSVTRRCEDCRSPGIPVEWRKEAPKPHRAKAPSAQLKAQRRRRQARLTATSATVAPARAPQQPAEQLPSIPAPPIEAAPKGSAEAFESKLDSYKAALGLLDD
jgi:hypothetical protein